MCDMNSWTVQIYLGVALILGVAGFLMWLPQNNFAVQNTMDTKVEELRYRKDLKVRKVPQTEYQMIKKREMTKEEKARLILKYKALKLDILHGIPLDIQVPSEKVKKPSPLGKSFMNSKPLMAMFLMLETHDMKFKSFFSATRTTC